jgi:hypothetical protein
MSAATAPVATQTKGERRRRGLRYALAILSGLLAVAGELRAGELEADFRRPPDTVAGLLGPVTVVTE